LRVTIKFTNDSQLFQFGRKSGFPFSLRLKLCLGLSPTGKVDVKLLHRNEQKAEKHIVFIEKR